MARHTVFGFKLERTEETVTAYGGLALLADRYLPGPGRYRGYAPSVSVDRLILMLQAGPVPGGPARVDPRSRADAAPGPSGVFRSRYARRWAPADG